MSDNCQKCGAIVPVTLRECPVCHKEAGFPNVKTAHSQQESAALSGRYKDALTSANARNVIAEVTSFEAAISTSSKAVMNRSLGALSNWLNGDCPMFYSFYHQVHHLNRTPAETEWDQQRGAAESTINPFFYQELSYAALTLDGKGMNYYGPYAVTLRSLTIDERASVFEQNPFHFCKTHHVVAGQAPPLGYRATWEDRGRLAVAKLQSTIKLGCSAEKFPQILMEPRHDASDCDFIEVHIFGPINRLGIERIVGPEPSRRADIRVWKQARRKAEEYGVIVEVTS